MKDPAETLTLSIVLVGATLLFFGGLYEVKFRHDAFADEVDCLRRGAKPVRRFLSSEVACIMPVLESRHDTTTINVRTAK